MTDQDRDLIARLRDALREPMTDAEYAQTFRPAVVRPLLDALDRLTRERDEAAAEAVRLKRLLEHVWLHVTTDEDFDADELRRDIERGGTVDELAGAIRQREGAERERDEARAAVADAERYMREYMEEGDQLYRQLAEARAAAIEEAARVCDRRAQRSCTSRQYAEETEAIECAADIRALASTPSPSPAAAGGETEGGE